MQNILLKPDIYWVGAVDYNLRNFHHYSRSPLGSTYNAYLVRDKKTVLFDTVSHNYLDELISHIENICPLESVDYIVCNHLEKDHAGVLPRIVELCKPEKIFVSVMGEKSIKGQFNTDGWPIHVVKDGDRINIGSRNITFFETRMLHWPDSMVSYLEEDHVLISNDAFGQNVATSRRFADQYSRTLLAEAIKDYYYNIVLPFSGLVLKVIERLAALPIDIIAPDHGLIFRTSEDVTFVLNTYKDLAEQKPKCQALLVYDSMWGATSQMAGAIGEGLDIENVPYQMMDLQNNHCSTVMAALADSGAVIMGSPTRNNMPMVTMMAMLAHMKGLKPLNRVAAAFGSYGWSGEAPKMIYDELTTMRMEMVGEPLRAYFTPAKEDLEKCVSLGKEVARALKAKCQ